MVSLKARHLGTTISGPRPPPSSPRTTSTNDQIRRFTGKMGLLSINIDANG
jgi:hypothetical protein